MARDEDKDPGESADWPQDDIVGRLRPDPSQPAEPSLTLTGFFGDSDREGFRRLYFTRDLDYYAEFRGEDVLGTVGVPADQHPFAGEEATRATLRRDATIEYTRTQTARPVDEFDIDVRLGALMDPAGRPPRFLTAETCFDCPVTPGTCAGTCETCETNCGTCLTQCGTCGRATCANTCATCATCGRATCGDTCGTACGTCDARACGGGGTETCFGTCFTNCGTCGEATCAGEQTCDTCLTNCGTCGEATCDTCPETCVGTCVNTCFTCPTCEGPTCHPVTCGPGRGCFLKG